MRNYRICAVQLMWQHVLTSARGLLSKMSANSAFCSIATPLSISLIFLHCNCKYDLGMLNTRMSRMPHCCFV